MPYDIRSPSSCTNTDIVDAVAWSNVNNVSYEDTMVARAEVSGSGSKYLTLTGFNFSIPTFATINGVLARVKRYANLSAGGHSGARIEDYEVKLIKGGVISGNNSIATPNIGRWETTPKYVTYGSSSSLWGLTLTPQDINDSDFGIAIAVIGNLFDSTEIAYIDHVELTVYYTDGVDIMSTDTVKKVINSNGVNQGAAIVTTTVKGEYDKVNPTINKAPLIDAVNAKMAGKFDDTTYYSN